MTIPGSRNLNWIEHTMTTLNKNPDKKELRNFGLITGSLAGGVFGIILPLLFDHAFPTWPWVIAAVLIVWALSVPTTLKPVYLVWMTIGLALGWVNTRIILGIMFYLIILPVGLIRKLLGKDSMARSMTPEMKSYRVQSRSPDKKHVEKPF